MHFGNTIVITKNTKLPLWKDNGDNRKVSVPAGRYHIEGTDGYFASRIIVEGVSVRYDH